MGQKGCVQPKHCWGMCFSMGHKRLTFWHWKAGKGLEKATWAFPLSLKWDILSPNLIHSSFCPYNVSILTTSHPSFVPFMNNWTTHQLHDKIHALIQRSKSSSILINAIYKGKSKQLSSTSFPNTLSSSAFAIDLPRIFVPQWIYWITHSSGVNLCVPSLEIPDHSGGVLGFFLSPTLC